MWEGKAFVVLPAAGCGQRFCRDIPKQFVDVLGKPLLCHTIETIHKIEWIQKIVVPVPSSWKKYSEELFKKCKFDKCVVISGDNTRHRSIYKGLQSLENIAATTDVVIVHDIVRPFLTEEFLKEIVDAASIEKASGAVRNLVSTIIKSNDDGYLEECLTRSRYRESHTPQAFHFDVLMKAYSKCCEDDFINGTEVLDLVLRYCNVHAKLLNGPDTLWKVTYKKDVQLMEKHLQNGLIDLK